MLLTIATAAVLLILGLATLWVIGRLSLVRSMVSNERDIVRVRDFHQNLVAYANSKGRDQNAFRDLAMDSTSIEGVLGWDNIVNGVRVGMYMLNNAPLLPLAVQEMRREYSDGYSLSDRGGEIADVVQTMIFRHLGRRKSTAELLADAVQSFPACVATGWSLVSALPVSILSAFGLLSSKKAGAIRGSFIFRIWSFALALASILGPVFAYLADREKIDAAIEHLIS